MIATTRTGHRRLMKTVLLMPLFAMMFTIAGAQSDDWSMPFEGHRVIGNLYAVGTHGLGVFLVTSDKGHILINSGLDDSTTMIRENVEALGFRMQDIRVLLTMQAHWDHAAALADIKALTGAEMWATSGDAALLEDGGFSDPLFGGKETFTPLPVEKFIVDGEVIELGDTRLTVHEHPGHTIGSSSYSMQVHEDGRDYDVVIANMASINPGTRFTSDATYPGIADDYATTFRKQRAMNVDVWVAAHGIQYRLHDKYRPGQAYRPDTFVDPQGFRETVLALQQVFENQLAEQQAAETQP